ncbi:uncharacterized protein TNCV_2257771 [Trichonephila clavipes]|nr:uncharacterized protein TNCV_2257771 [Trichonephila clavipes]
MRNSRSQGPPSTLSGSSSSGRGLVAGSYIGRIPPPSTFASNDRNKENSKNRTKVIIILGIALPVLACIIGVAAWAVTTDVLRISPRPYDNPYNRYGPQGKTRETKKLAVRNKNHLLIRNQKCFFPVGR